MTKAIYLHEQGGPNVLKYQDIDISPPAANEAQVRHKAIGLNYIDVYHRSGLYPLSTLPSSIGMEGAGVVEEIGSEVTEVNIGDRVAYAAPPPGAYVEERNIASENLVKLPDSISFEQGAGMMLQGMTVEYLIRRTYPVKKGETVLVHAAAGGVGLIQCQWLNHIGATIIGTVGTDEKATLAQAHGCHHAINYRKENWVQRVKELTDGEGVPVVYDSVCNDTFTGSLECLKRLGLMVNFGQASGPYNEFETSMLAPKSLFLTRPTLFAYNATRKELESSASALFEVVQNGAVKIEVNQSYSLSEATQAHIDLESRKTTGSSILIP